MIPTRTSKKVLFASCYNLSLALTIAHIIATFFFARGKKLTHFKDYAFNSYIIMRETPNFYYNNELAFVLKGKYMYIEEKKFRNLLSS